MLPLNGVASIVAIIGGTVAATISVVKFLDSRRDKKHLVKVKITHAMPFNIPGVSGDLVLVEAANHGFRPVTLTAWGILLPNRSTLVAMNTTDGTVRLPHKLPPGDNCTMWMQEAEMRRSLLQAGFRGNVKLVGFYTDALDTRHKSKFLIFRLPA